MTDKKKKRLLWILCLIGIPLLAAVWWWLGNPSLAPSAQITLSEVMSQNRTVLAAEDGTYYDWVELQNTGSYAVSTKGLFLTDDVDQPDRYAVPETVLQPSECLIIYLTGNNKETRVGYAPFGLRTAGDTVYLFAKDKQIDALNIVNSPENASFGRLDGHDVWFAVPTPGVANHGPATATAAEWLNAYYTGLLISEVCAVSDNDDLLAPTDWVELYNATDTPLSLRGYRLTDAPENAGFTFGDVTIPARGYYALSCDGDLPEGVEPCAPFSLNRGGETLYLYTPSGAPCDMFETGKQRLGVSAGRVGDNRGKRVYFDEPTKGAVNGEGLLGFAPMPTVNTVGGYVATNTTVTITVPDGCTVHYTLSGANPTEHSARYDGTALTLTETTVLRAVAFREGYLPSDTVTQTFLVTEPHDIPVLSVSGSPNAIGGIFADYMNENLSTAVHAEYFDKNGKALAFDSTFKLSGGLSRQNPQKAFSLKLSQVTGASSVVYPFFKDTDRTEFGDLLLRPSGADWSGAKLRDEFCATALKGQNGLLIQSAAPVAVYVNGQYKGLYYLREKRNEDFVSAYTGIPKERVQIAKHPSLFEWNVKLDPDFDAIITYARRHDLRDEEHYQHIVSQIDEESLMRYFIVQTYFGNGDMINNVAAFRDREGGEWQWILFDLDWACTAFYENHQFLRQLYDGSGQNTYQNYYYPLMTALLQNEAFSHRFLELYAEMMNTTLSAERLTPILDEMAAEIRSEIPRQHAAYGAPSTARFEGQVTYMRAFLARRQDNITAHLKSVFSLTDEDWDALNGR